MTPKHEQFRRSLKRLRSVLAEPEFIDVDKKDLELLLAVHVHQNAVIKELTAKLAGKKSHGSHDRSSIVRTLPTVTPPRGQGDRPAAGDVDGLGPLTGLGPDGSGPDCPAAVWPLGAPFGRGPAPRAV